MRAGGKTLLDAVTLAFAPGECVAIVGPNGAGKTTLLRLLCGELKPRSGAVRLKGRDVASYTPRTLAEHRAVLSQDITVVFPFTVAEIVRMGAGDRRGPRIEALVADALREVDLAALGERIITTLSGGEQQRAHFARVLVQLACGEAVHGPGVLMLDEPTASLDLRHQLDLLDGDAALRRARRHRDRDPARPQSGGAVRRPHRGAQRRPRRRRRPAARDHHRRRCWRGCSRSAPPSAAHRRPACRSCCRTP